MTKIRISSFSSELLHVLQPERSFRDTFLAASGPYVLVHFLGRSVSAFSGASTICQISPRVSFQLTMTLTSPPIDAFSAQHFYLF